MLPSGAALALIIALLAIMILLSAAPILPPDVKLMLLADNCDELLIISAALISIMPVVVFAEIVPRFR